MTENNAGNWKGTVVRFLRDLQDRSHNDLENRDALHAHPASAIDGLTPGGTANALQLLSEQIVLIATTTVTFSGLDINTDRMYMLCTTITNAAVGTSIFTVYVNNDAVNVFGRDAIFSGNALTVGGAVPRVALNLTTNVGSFATTNIIRDATGVVRFLINRGEQLSNGTSGFQMGYTTVTHTNVTRIDVTSSQANGIAAGSTFQLYRVSPT